MHVYRQLYSSLSLHSVDIQDKAQGLKSCLEGILGANRFRAMYAGLTLSVTNSMDFEALHGFFKQDDVWQLFPLFVQLLQLENIRQLQLHEQNDFLQK